MSYVTRRTGKGLTVLLDEGVIGHLHLASGLSCIRGALFERIAGTFSL